MATQKFVIKNKKPKMTVKLRPISSKGDGSPVIDRLEPENTSMTQPVTRTLNNIVSAADLGTVPIIKKQFTLSR